MSSTLATAPNDLVQPMSGLTLAFDSPKLTILRGDDRDAKPDYKSNRAKGYEVDLWNDLVLYGIPAHVDAVYTVAEEYYREHNQPFKVDYLLLYVGLQLINDACGVLHITAHATICPYDDDHTWAIALYSDRNMTRRRGFPDPETEDRFVETVQRLLGLDETPPKLWFGA